MPFFLLLIKQEKNKKVLFCISLFFLAYYLGAYTFFVALYPMDFVGLGYISSFFILLFAWALLSFFHCAVMSLGIYFTFRLCDKTVYRILSTALVFVLIEYLQSIGSFGFPWARFSLPQYNNIQLIQSASLFGPYFVDFLMLLTRQGPSVIFGTK